MDPATLALTAAGLLAMKALEAVGDKAGEGAWAVLGRIREAIWSRFRGDQEVTETLKRLEADPPLVAELTRLVEEAKAESQTASFVTTVQDNAHVGKLTNIGQISGDVHL